MRPDKSIRDVLLLNIVLNLVTCVFSTYCIFVQTIEYHKVFEMNLGNEPFLCIPLWHPFLFFSSSEFQVRLGAELSKDNRLIYSFKILLYFIIFHIELQHGWECLLWLPKGKG